MKDNVKVLNVLISCPSDVQDEIKVIREVIEDINRQSIDRHGLFFQVKHWSRDIDTEIGTNPQDYINTNLVDDCDVLISVFKSRFGTPTHNANSGTQEEIDRFIKSSKKCFIYFAKRGTDVDISSCDLEQMQKIREYRQLISDSSLYNYYDSIENLKDIFNRDFNLYLTKLVCLENKSPQTIETKTDVLIDESQNSIQNNEFWDSVVEIIDDLGFATSKLQEFTSKTNNFAIKTQEFTSSLTSLKSNSNVNPFLIKTEITKYANKLDEFSNIILEINDSTKDVWKRIYENSEVILSTPVRNEEDKNALANFYMSYLTSMEPIKTLKEEITKSISQFVKMKGYQKDITKAVIALENTFNLFTYSLDDFIINSQIILDKYIQKEEV